LKIPFFKNTGNTEENQGIRLNRRVITFLFCVLISAFFWLMLSLSKEYNIQLSFPVTYTNLPLDKVVANHLSETIDIEIKSKGFNLLGYKLKQKNEPIVIDTKDAQASVVKNHFYLLTNSIVDKITKQFSNDIKIIRIYPDTILLNFNKKITKLVPVKSNLQIAFDNHYQQSDSVKLVPSMIRISGAADILDKINYVETESSNLKNVSDSVSVKLTILKTPALKQVDLSSSTVQATVNVTKYTEASIELPIEIENLPPHYRLKLFPDKVSIKYNVAFKNYEKINALQFHAVVDYLKIEPGSNKLKIQLLKAPSEIRAVKMNPEKVEYIIKK
jgi:YbbR domain-containing protein